MVLSGVRRRAADGRERGAIAVLVAVVVAVVVVPLLATVTDLGLTRVLSTRARTAADAAALAAAAWRPASNTDANRAKAVADARTLVAHNLPVPDGGWPAAWAGCVDPNPLPDGTAPFPGDCISFDYAVKQVRVTVPARPVPGAFSGVLGTSAPDAGATSSATWGDRISPSVGSCALCVLDTYTSGSERVRVSGGDAAIGTTLTVTLPGLLTVTPPSGVTYGTWWSRSGRAVSPLPLQRPAPPDPFATTLSALQAAVPYGQPSNLPPSSGACTQGAYRTITGCSSFAPGTYYVTGNPSSVQQVSLTADANGVLLYFTCNQSGPGGTVLVARCPSISPMPRFTGPGSAAHTLSAPGGSGLALVFDQGFARNELLNSAYQLTVVGDVYGPGVTLRPGGSGLAVVRGRVVVKAVSGNATYPRATILEVDAPPIIPSAIQDGPVRLVRSD